MQNRLPPVARLFWLTVSLSLGIAPSLLFFAWVERNCALPWVPQQLDWPWVWLGGWEPSTRGVWNLALVLVFGLVHSGLAQPAAHRALGRLVPPQALRTVYLATTGVSLLSLMGAWQSTGIVIWALPLPYLALQGLSLALYYGLLIGALRLVTTLRLPEFLGLSSIYATRAELARTEGTPELVTRGIYARVRHPIYAFTLLAFALGPVMTLDRLLVLAGSALYLAFGIPIEERKLRAQFGAAYDEYRRRVPALLPTPGRRADEIR
jgi:protein-S-isoprenylcysteine O-methyltransferase Ste14